MLSVKCLIEDLVAVYNAVKCLIAVYNTAYDGFNCNIVAVYNTVMLSVTCLIPVYNNSLLSASIFDGFCLQSWFRHMDKVKFVKHARDAA